MIPLTEVLRANYGWQTAIRIPALLTVLAFVLCAAVSKPRTASVATTQTLGSTLLLAARDWRLRRFTLAAFLSGVAASTLLVFQVPTMTWAGVSTSVAAGLASARGLMQLAGRLPLMAAMKRFGAPRLMIASRALLGVAALLLLGSGQWAVAVLYVAIAGITIGALSALDGVVARSVIGAQNFGAVMGGIGLLSTLGGSSGPILGGQLRDWSGSPVASMMLVAATAWLATVVFASLGLARQDSATS
jgi:predicted MFS family arabinose efflux permease